MKLLLDEMYSERLAELLGQSDFLPLLDRRQSAGLTMTPVLVALKAGRGVGGALHARLAHDIDGWATDNPDPYHHAHWLP